AGPNMPSRNPLDALSLVLGSVEAVRNLRALYVLLMTFASAGLLTAMAEASLIKGGLWGPVQAGAALFVTVYGGSAARVLLVGAAPGVWAGTRVLGLVRQLATLARQRLLTVALLVAAVSLLTAGVGAIVTFVVMAGGRIVSELGVAVVGVDVPAQQLMAG